MEKVADSIEEKCSDACTKDRGSSLELKTSFKFNYECAWIRGGVSWTI